LKVQWTRSAQADLDEITRYIKAKNPEAAKRIKRAIIQSTFKLGQFPDIGRGTLRRGYRLLVVAGQPYLLGYRVMPDYVEIGAVFDGRADRPADIY
jgi:addiction module RelE/StbE family toxin